MSKSCIRHDGQYGQYNIRTTSQNTWTIHWTMLQYFFDAELKKALSFNSCKSISIIRCCSSMLNRPGRTICKIFFYIRLTGTTWHKNNPTRLPNIQYVADELLFLRSFSSTGKRGGLVDLCHGASGGGGSNHVSNARPFTRRWQFCGPSFVTNKIIRERVSIMQLYFVCWITACFIRRQIVTVIMQSFSSKAFRRRKDNEMRRFCLHALTSLHNSALLVGTIDTDITI